MVSRILTLLIADDSPSDIKLFKMALGNHPICHRIHTVPDGEAAMEFLRRGGRYADAPPIDLLVLDINMPRKSGHEVLLELKNDPDLRRIPVVMLSSSASPLDVYRAYDSHANCYVQKPTELDSWFNVVRAIHDFWSQMVAFPPHQ